MIYNMKMKRWNWTNDINEYLRKKTERDISQLRWSWKIWDDAFTVITYKRDYEQTFLEVYKDRTWWDLQTYEITYDRWDFKFLQAVI